MDFQTYADLAWNGCIVLQNLVGSFQFIGQTATIIAPAIPCRWLADFPIPGGGNPKSCTKAAFCVQNLEFIPAAFPFPSPNPDFPASLKHFNHVSHMQLLKNDQTPMSVGWYKKITSKDTSKIIQNNVFLGNYPI